MKRTATCEEDIDLALAVLCALIRPGERLTYRQISEVTGLSHGGPYMIEQAALRKLRNRVRFGSEAVLTRELA